MKYCLILHISMILTWYDVLYTNNRQEALIAAFVTDVETYLKKYCIQINHLAECPDLLKRFKDPQKRSSVMSDVAAFIDNLQTKHNPGDKEIAQILHLSFQALQHDLNHGKAKKD